MAEEHAFEDDVRQRQLSDTFQAQSVDTLWSLDTAGLVTDAVHGKNWREPTWTP